MEEKKQPTSSIHLYRQPAPPSVTIFGRVPSASQEFAIQVGPNVGIHARNHQWPNFTKEQSSRLSRLVEDRAIDELDGQGGVRGLAEALKTHIQMGIDESCHEDIKLRREFFGTNSYPAKPLRKSFFNFVLEELKGLTILILLVCAALSLGIGIKQQGAREGWYHGASTFAAIFVVISITAISNFMLRKKFDNIFDEVNSGIIVVVMRKGIRQKIKILDVVVGDVVCLKIGDQVPADGLFIEGLSLQIDESSLLRSGRGDCVEINTHQNPFLFSGTKVADGYATMLVTAVGVNTNWGKMMSTISRDPEEKTPLLDLSRQLTWILSKVGLVGAFVVLVTLLVYLFIGKTRDENGNKKFVSSRFKVDDFIHYLVDIIATAVVIMIVAIPKGLPLAIRLTLAYSIKEMKGDHQVMVRNLSACEVMASVKTICTDMKRIIASSSKMKVSKFFVGKDSMERISYTSIAANVLELFFQGIRHSTDRVHKFLPVTPIDETILGWAVLKWNMELTEDTNQFSVLSVKESSPENWRMGISLKNELDNTIHLHWKGDADKIFQSCSHYYDSAGNITALSDAERERFRELIDVDMGASNKLRCIAFAHRQLSDVEYRNEATNHQEIPDHGLILLGLVGVEDHCRPGVREAIETCRRAEIHIKLITSENISRARAIVLECGILSRGQEGNGALVVEAQEFFNYTEEEQKLRVGDIKVMAMSSDEHKLQMVRLLKNMSHGVAVIGDGINDVPTLREADIGVAMGELSAKVAKESSDVIILDDNFAKVAQIVCWGHCIYDNVQKFIQFQLTITVAALLINFVSVVSSGKAPLTVAQLLWVNLIIDNLSALALAADEKPPEEILMLKPPVRQTDLIITNIMWRNILGQAFYQVAVVLTLMFKGESIFDVHEKVITTIIFTTFVLCQVFNQFNARRIEKKNVFEGIVKNKLFIGITGMTIILQVIFVEFLNKLVDMERLNLKQWAACIVLAAFSWPFGCLIKCLPVPENIF